MERIIEIVVRDKIAFQPNNTEYVCDNTDYIAEFDFDEEWDGVDPKTARFVYGDEHQDIVFTGNRCEIPRISDVNSMRVGVFAGNLVTTTPAQVICRRSILGKSGLPADPAPDVYAQIMEVAFPAAVAAAEESAKQAADSEQNAKAYETNAEQSAKNAAESAENLSTAEKNAKESAEQAKNSETNAKTSEGNAKTSENNAKASETAASGSASDAAVAKENAEKAKTDAEAAATRAEAARQGIEQFTSGVEKSATDAKEAAKKAEQHETNAKTAEQNVRSYENQFAAYAQEAKTAAETAKKSASDADTDAKTASQKASDAQTYANNANTAASNAKTSETNADKSATNAEKAATDAKASADNATNAEQNAKLSETNSLNYAQVAKTYSENARGSENRATESATNAKNAENEAKAYAVNARSHMQQAGTLKIAAEESAAAAAKSAEEAKKSADSVDFPKPTPEAAGKAVVVNASGDGFTLGEVPSSGGGSQADWNAAEGEPGHILNKPFGDKEVYILPETELTFADMGEGCMAAFEPLEFPIEGNAYSITFGGSTYECVAYYDKPSASYALGNIGALSGGENTGEPFIVMIQLDEYGNIGMSLMLSLIGETTTNVSIAGIHPVPIAPEYAPNTVSIDLATMGLDSIGTGVMATLELDDDTANFVEKQLAIALKNGIVKVRLFYDGMAEKQIFAPGNVVDGSVGGEDWFPMLVSGNTDYCCMYSFYKANLVFVEYHNGTFKVTARGITFD